LAFFDNNCSYSYCKAEKRNKENLSKNISRAALKHLT
jgi:hypothetical protein